MLVGGLGTFWPSRVTLLQLADGRRVLGQWLRTTENSDTKVTSVQLKTGNREINPAREDFHWYKLDDIRRTTYPADVFVVERQRTATSTGTCRMSSFTAGPTGQLPVAGLYPPSRLQAAVPPSAANQADLDPLAARLVPLTYAIHSLEVAEAGASTRANG